MSQAQQVPRIPLSPHTMPFLLGEGDPGAHLSVFRPRTGLPSTYTLQEVQVAIINNSMCNHLFQKTDFRVNIWGDMICAGNPAGGKDACFVSITAPHHGFWAQHLPFLAPSSIQLSFTRYLIHSQTNPGK